MPPKKAITKGAKGKKKAEDKAAKKKGKVSKSKGKFLLHFFICELLHIESFRSVSNQTYRQEFQIYKALEEGSWSS